MNREGRKLVSTIIADDVLIGGQQQDVQWVVDRIAEKYPGFKGEFYP